MEAKKIEAWNTRLAKDADGSLEIRLAACETKSAPPKVTTEDFEGKTIRVKAGDYGTLLAPVIEHLKKAEAQSANDEQKEMIACYVEHFTTGELQKHKDSQIAWVKDVGPAVETTIGFIENYRDGYGERSEWEGFVSAVNRDQSTKFDNLVSQAEVLLPKLPWPKEFEKDTFQRPDFTALDVIGFASSGIPVGINIPNYDDVRQNNGFKNVHLHNVLSSRFSDPKDIPFILAEDQEVFKSLRVRSFEVQVGLHELLGHGSGKMLSKDDVDGKNVPDPLNPGSFITKYYADGATWSSVFKSLASSWEECRAESVGIYLCLEPKVLEIFGFTTEKEQSDCIYCNWLNMVHAGLVGLEFYSPDAQRWGQAHMHARFAILITLLNAGENFVKLDVDEAAMTASISLDRSKIATVGKKAICDFLTKLQVMKSTADVEAGTTFFGDLTNVTEKWRKIRDIVLKHKKPRPVYVQAHLIESAPGKVEVLEFTPTVKGMLLSMQYHFGELSVAQARALLNGGEAEDDAPKQLSKPSFGSVSDLAPENKGVNLRMKVVSAPTLVTSDGVPEGMAEVVVGDASGVVTLTLRPSDTDTREALKTPGTPVTVRNGRVNMISLVKGGDSSVMRLIVDKWGKITPGAGDGAADFKFEPNTSKDVSAVEFRKE
jgi:dipeptidyl-peptidase-3